MSSHSIYCGIHQDTFRGFTECPRCLKEAETRRPSTYPHHCVGRPCVVCHKDHRAQLCTPLSVDGFVAMMHASGLGDVRLGETRVERDHRAQLTRALVGQQWVVACALFYAHTVEATWRTIVAGGSWRSLAEVDTSLDTPADAAARILGDDP